VLASSFHSFGRDGPHDAARSNSFQAAPNVSPDLAAVSIVKSKARAEIAFRFRGFLKEAGTST
jgi:hypothetical protein